MANRSRRPGVSDDPLSDFERELLSGLDPSAEAEQRMWKGIARGALAGGSTTLAALLVTTKGKAAALPVAAKLALFVALPISGGVVYTYVSDPPTPALNAPVKASVQGTGEHGSLEQSAAEQEAVEQNPRDVPATSSAQPNKVNSAPPRIEAAPEATRRPRRNMGAAPKSMAASKSAERPRVEAPSAQEKEPVALPDAASRKEETRLVRAARTALRSGQHTRALQHLAELDRKHRRGMLVQERRFLRIQVLSAQGLTSEASRHAAAFLKAFPKSAYAPEVSRLVGKTK